MLSKDAWQEQQECLREVYDATRRADMDRGEQKGSCEPLMLLQVVVRRNRLCVAVKAGRQSDLPRGSMTLATSSTGRLPPGHTRMGL